MTIQSRTRRGVAVLLSALLAVAGVAALGSTSHAATQEIPIQDLSWKYLDNNTDPTPDDPHAWAAPEFDDSAWPEAAGSFGALRGAIAELSGGFTPDNLLTQYQDNGDNVPTFFFRTTFDAPQAVLDGVTSITATFHYDDAISVFVNGTYVGGGHDQELMAEDNPNRSYGGWNGSAPQLATIDIPLDTLVAGDNTIGVRLHNGRASSSDLYFGADRLILSDDVQLSQVEWRYHDLDVDPSPADPHAWAQPGFDDSAWPSEVGSFGAKDGELGRLSGDFYPEHLLTQYQEGTEDNIPAFFFRGNVRVGADLLDEAVSVVAKFYYDDAVSLYVNGVYAGGAHDDAFREMANPNRSYGGSNGGAPNLSEIHIDPALLNVGDNLFAVRLHNGRASSSDLYFEAVGLEKNTEVPEGVTNELLLGGATQLDRNFVWYSSEFSGETVVQLAKTADLTGDNWDDVAQTIAPETTGASNVQFLDYHHAGVTGLEADTGYTWRVGSETEGWNGPYEFATQGDDEFEFLFIGDAQIGSGDRERDAEGWANTLNRMTEQFPGIELLVSAGDQVETATQEAEYRGLLAPKEMKELTFVPTIGNHDVGSQTVYDQHFNLPNYDEGLARNHWYGYGDVQFLHINTDFREDYDLHKAWLEAAIAEGADDYRYRIVVMHRGLFSTANHSNTSTTESLRRYFSNRFSEMGIDLVLAGHDHVYARSHLMVGTNPVSEGVQAEHTPADDEVQYITFNSSSGSKYYNIREGADPAAGVVDPYFDFVSVTDQLRTPTFGKVAVTECSINVQNYRVDTMEITDEVTLNLPKDPTFVIDRDRTIKIDDVAMFDPFVGAIISQCPDTGAEVRVTGSVEAEAGSYVLTYELVDAQGNVIDTAQRTITVEAGDDDPSGEPSEEPSDEPSGQPSEEPTDDDQDDRDDDRDDQDGDDDRGGNVIRPGLPNTGV